MKLKYYLRGLGIGIIITTIILTIAYSNRKLELTDEEIIQRAEALGMVMQEDSLFPFGNKELNTEAQSEIENRTEVQQETEHLTSSKTEADAAHQSEEEAKTDDSTNINEEAYLLVIFPGMVAQNISNELEEHGVVEDGYELRTYLAEVGYTKLLKVGKYEIPYGASKEEIYQILKDGPL